MTANGTASQATGRNTYLLTVDHERSVEDAVKPGRYDWVSDDINSNNFPKKRTGRADIVVELIRFNGISTDDALRELDKMGYRPAELHELLAFGEKHPDIQRAFPIVALGSVWQRRLGDCLVPCLDGSGSERHLDLHWFKDDWFELYRFAAVRK